ncbi:carboxylesterase [Ammoniphilus sp. YIM 78166]|uniref:alpha/beta hydrolase n=1 Tax=Ammoniphilus sp. YIM 78166 TaxID=1644106 RepID=UPI00106FE687|nr:alpha/beta fold hydrolase [Ammoniphilus sp. YIM 78166]
MKRYIPNTQGLRIHHVEHHHSEDQLFILAHGFTGSLDSHVIASFRQFLNGAGLSNVSIDFTNNLNGSDGQFANHTISGEVDDLKVIYDAYRDRYQKVYLIGHSMGCTVASQFALKHEVDGLLLVAPPFSIREIILGIAQATFGNVNAALAKWERDRMFPIYKERDQKHYPLSYEFYRDLNQIDPNAFQRITSPSAIIYSLADPVVPPAQSEQLFHNLGTDHKKLFQIEAAPHSFDTPGATQALLEAGEQAIEFLGAIENVRLHKPSRT